MENIVFTQLSISEVRHLFREEVINVMSKLPEDIKQQILNPALNINCCKKRSSRKKELVND
jgi:hypothetical protein